MQELCLRSFMRKLILTYVLLSYVRVGCSAPYPIDVNFSGLLWPPLHPRVPGWTPLKAPLKAASAWQRK